MAKSAVLRQAPSKASSEGGLKSFATTRSNKMLQLKQGFTPPPKCHVRRGNKWFGWCAKRGSSNVAPVLMGGFTLIEVVLTIVIISVGLFGMMILFDNVTRGAMEADVNVAAVFLAREKLEKIVFDKVYSGYDFVQNSAYTSPENVSVAGNNYTRTLNIYEVAKSDLATLQSGSNFKRIDITVQWGTGAAQRIIESTLLTR